MTDEQQDQADEIAQLQAELRDQTARANALDVRASAAERVAISAAEARNTGQVLTMRGTPLTNALELWDRVEKQDHPTRARDYGDAVQQLAEANIRVPALEPELWRQVERNAKIDGEAVPDWLAAVIDQYLMEHGAK